MKRPKPRDKRQELERCPQKGGIVTRVYTMSPKKPNSAIRKASWACRALFWARFRPFLDILGLEIGSTWIYET